MCLLPRLSWALSRMASLSLFRDQRGPVYFVIHCICCLENTDAHCFVIHKTHKMQPWLLFSVSVPVVLSSEESPTGSLVWFLGTVCMWHLGQVGFQSPALAVQAQYTEYPTKSPMCWTGLFFPAWKVEKGFQSTMKHLIAEKNTSV